MQEDHFWLAVFVYGQASGGMQAAKNVAEATGPCLEFQHQCSVAQSRGQEEVDAHLCFLVLHHYLCCVGHFVSCKLSIVISQRGKVQNLPCLESVCLWLLLFSSHTHIYVV